MNTLNSNRILNHYSTLVLILLLMALHIESRSEGPPPNDFSIDPVTSIATWSPPDSSSSELLGYMMFIDSATITIITDTTFDYGYFWYGSSHTAGIAAVYNTNLSDTLQEPFVSEYLIPPDSLEGDLTTGILVHLSWSHPAYREPGQPDSIPENLIAYDIFLDGDSIDRVYYPTSEYLHQPQGPFLKTQEYSIKAVYLLIPYGFPGQTASSASEGPVEIPVGSCCDLPFFEYWNSGNYSQWYDVYCDSWIVNNNSGNPAPAAQFIGGNLPEYNCAFESWDLGKIRGDGFIQISFDLKLDDLTASGTEHFKLFIHSPDTLYEVFQISNEGSFGWKNYSLDISEFTLNNPDYTLYFEASGINGSNIANWSLDNIEAWYVCPAPYDLTTERFEDQVFLSWISPDTAKLNQNLLGYNIFREKNGSGNWSKLNEMPVETTNFTDTLLVPGSYAYYVTAVFDGCESEASNLAEVSFFVSRNELAAKDENFKIYPNPSDSYFIVENLPQVCKLYLLDAMGRIIRLDVLRHGNAHYINTSQISEGLYLLQINTGSKSLQEKIIIRHQD